jgi:hypothetical protein
MSHFVVLVVGENVEKQLAPFHEFECTGQDDEFVQEIDQTAQLKEEYEKVEKEIKKEYPTFLAYVRDYHGKPVATSIDRIDLNETHKYGYVLVGPDGEVVKVIDRTNPEKKWDWWEIGGRWTGFFKLKNGRKGMVGQPGIQTPRAKRGYADSCPKSAIDIEGMQEEAEARAQEKWDNFQAIAEGLPRHTSWETTREKYGDENGGIEKARKEYHAQPVIQALSEAKGDAIWWDADEFLCSREEYLKRARDEAFSTFAVLKDGKWYERGEMGWWACVSNEKSKEEWAQQFSQLVEGLPEDTLLTVVDCHI